MSVRREKHPGLVRRHGLLELAEHWAVAVSGLVLVVTGIFELPIAQRYYITELPGLAWSGDFIVSLNIHYAASVVFVAAALFHAVYHGLLGETGMLPKQGDLKASVEVIRSFLGKGEEPPFHKYLPEQRLAYAGMAVIIAGLILSGLVKTYKNVYAPEMPLWLVMSATWAHNLFFVLFVLAFVAHIAAIAIRPNRPLVRSIFTGHVRLDYARARHPLWLESMGMWGETPPPAEELSSRELEQAGPAGEQEPPGTSGGPEPESDSEQPAGEDPGPRGQDQERS